MILIFFLNRNKMNTNTKALNLAVVIYYDSGDFEAIVEKYVRERVIQSLYK